MTGLNTLKDCMHWRPTANTLPIFGKAIIPVDATELRQKAINHLLELETEIRRGSEVCDISHECWKARSKIYPYRIDLSTIRCLQAWIKHFFNISEKDLEDAKQHL